jgi:ElaB/YqjD/DUF883 family membrane-anchored ribosome-binding protein
MDQFRAKAQSSFNSTKMAEDIERLVGQLDTVRNRMMHVADAVLHEVQDRLKDAAPAPSTMRHSAEQRIEELTRDFASLSDRLTDTGRGASNRTVQFVQERPLVSLGMAFGAGFLIARWLKRG